MRALQVVMEHITTKNAADFVASAGDNVAASITPQHILLNRNALFVVRPATPAVSRQQTWLRYLPVQGGLRPHNYCLPVLKREEHREAVLQAAVSGNPRFFLGTDSAPHPVASNPVPA